LHIFGEFKGVFDMRSTALAVMLLSTVLSGCAAVPGWGTASIPVKTFKTPDINLISSKYTNVACKVGTGCTSGIYKDDSWLDMMQKCSVSPAPTNCVPYRNAMISELTLVINHNHAVYEGNLLAGRSKADFYVGSGRTALETAATLIDPAGVKTVLSSLATFTGVIQDKSDEAFYFKQSAPVLSQMMQAERSKVTAEIRIARDRAYDKYTIADAVDDLDRYYRAGTMAKAIATMNQQAAAISSKAEEKVSCLRIAPDAAAQTACMAK
jgi:hypothetical protein